MAVNELAKATEPDCHVMLEHFIYQRGDKGVKLLSTLQRYIRYCAYKFQPLSPEDQQEVLQEVAIKLLGKAEQVQTNCLGWIFTIVRNEYIDVLRRQTTRTQTFVAMPDTHDSHGELVEFTEYYQLAVSGDDNLFIEAECLEQVFKQIEQQPTGAEDMVMYTRYAQGDSNEEIASVVGRTVGAVAKRLSLLRERVRQLRDVLC